MVKRNSGSMLSYNVTTCPLGHRSGRAVRFPSCTLACGAGEEGVPLPSPKPTTATVGAHGQSRSAFATGHRAHGSLFPGKRTLLVFDELFSQHPRRRHVAPGVEIQYSHTRIGVPSSGQRQFDSTTSNDMGCAIPPDGYDFPHIGSTPAAAVPQ